MRKRRRLLVGLTLLLLVSGLVLVPQLRCPIYGWLRDEAFYEGMPTSWWVHEIEESYHYIGRFAHGPFSWYVKAQPSLWDSVQDRLNRGTPRVALPIGPPPGPLLSGDPDALAVLLGLVCNESAKVRRVAIDGLMVQQQKRSEAVQALLKAMNDPDEEVRHDATMALHRLDPEAAAAADSK